MSQKARSVARRDTFGRCAEIGNVRGIDAFRLSFKG